MEVAEENLSQWIWRNDEGKFLVIRENMFEENQFFLDGFYSAIFKGCYVASMNYGEVSCGPFLLSRMDIG